LFLRLYNCASVGEKKIDNYQDAWHVCENYCPSSTKIRMCPILAHHCIINFYKNLFSCSKDNTCDCQTAMLIGMFVLLFTGNMPKAAGRKKKPCDERVLPVS
jgi:hypothetical protein